jgi:hypothetical protein
MIPPTAQFDISERATAKLRFVNERLADRR